MAKKKNETVAAPAVENGAASTAVAETEPVAPKAPRVTLENKNGVSRPKSGTKTGRVWEISDALSAAAGAPAKRKDVIEKGIAESINQATIATQYGRWRQFHGLGREKKPVVATPATEGAAAPAADVTVE